VQTRYETREYDLVNRFARDFLIGIDPQHEHFRSAENVYLTKQNAEYRF